MKVEDFQEKNFIYVSNVKIWDKNISLEVDFVDSKNISEALKTNLETINRSIKYIELNKDKIKDFMATAENIELVNNWIESAEKKEDRENTYIIDGQEVDVPISKDEFINNLNVSLVALNFSKDGLTIFLYLDFTPDYLEAHNLTMYINNDGSYEMGELV